MAIDNRLQVFNEEGQSVDYDILASDVKFNDGKDLPTKLAEMEEEIGEGGYTPPAGGIPKTDLAPSVQQTLDDVANKVDKVPGKGLSTNDYTTAEKTKLQNLPTADQLTQQLGSKANDNEVVKSISVNGTSQTKDGNGNVNVVVPTVVLDDAPTDGSPNGVKSGGIKAALDAKANAADVPTKTEMADAIDDALGEAQVTVVPENSVGIINSLGSDSDSDALSAAMGKKLKVALLQILSSLGSYAFPNGKPTLDFGDIVTFSVTKTIGTGLSATGGDTDVELGDSLEVSIAITDNLYIVDDDSVVVTMGGSPVAGAWNASTMKVTIASVTGNVVINVPSMTYVSSGLVMNMDCKNTGGTAGHWKSIDGTYDFALTDVSVSTSGAVFNGSSSKAVISNGASLNIGAGDGTVESVFTLGSPSVASPILVNSVDGNIGCACYPFSSIPHLSFRCATSASGELKYAKQIDVTKTNYAVGINTERWYIDGMESSEAAEDGWLTIDGVTVLALGYRHRSSVDNYLNGTIKCVRVYNRKLTPSEMLQNYKVDKKRFNLS